MGGALGEKENEVMYIRDRRSLTTSNGHYCWGSPGEHLLLGLVLRKGSHVVSRDSTGDSTAIAEVLCWNN